jgi:hypothetical protein
MKISEIQLLNEEPILLRGMIIGTVNQREVSGRNDGLNVNFKTARSFALEAVVDIGEQLEVARIFTMEASPENTIVIFGGERMYWLNTSGEILRDVQLALACTQTSE